MGAMPGQIRKRDGSLVPFDPSRIEEAVARAAGGRAGLPARVKDEVVGRLADRDDVAVEEVQDLVEEALMRAGASEVARAYILYREKRARVRSAKGALGVRDDLKLGVNAARVLDERYLRKDAAGRTVETPREMFSRVASAVAAVEPDKNEWEERFFRAMCSLEFLPNSPALMNAGTDVGQLAACFVLPVDDSILSIFDALRAMALIHQSGGGTGFSFSRLRPKDSPVRSTGGVASGPVSFMRIFDLTTEIIKQGGRRRGANMGVLRADHPDVLEFITAKADGVSFTNFNLSVSVTDSFMRGGSYPTIDPRTGEERGELDANAVLDAIAFEAWRRGDPGLLFMDRIDRDNPTPSLGRIEATNPCGEQPLLPFEACVLGSVNVRSCVKGEALAGEKAGMDWDKLKGLVGLGVRFLDDCVEISDFPLPEIDRVVRGNRKVGLGLMGFADALIALGIPYDSDRAEGFAHELMGRFGGWAREASAELARERGAFPNWPESVWKERGIELRNAGLTTIAPTGSISLIAGTSSGIEPLFALSYVRRVLSGEELEETHPALERIARARGFHSRALMDEVAATGRLPDSAPEEVRRVMTTAHEVAPERHVRIQAAFQEHTDNAVSKTVNLPEDATPADARRVFTVAHKLGCKGITVYRQGSREGQVLEAGCPRRCAF